MNIEQLKYKFQTAQVLPDKERIKQFKALGRAIVDAFTSTEEHELMALETYIEILKYILQTPSISQTPTLKSNFNKYLSKIIVKRNGLLKAQNVDPIKLKEELAQAQNLQGRERLKRNNEIGFTISEIIRYKTEHEIKDLDILHEIMQYLIRVAPSKNALFYEVLSLIESKRLSLLGYPDPQTLFKIDGNISLEGGSICIGDYAFAKDIEQFNRETRSTEDCPNKFFIIERELINTGQMYIFGTSGDGSYDIRLRIIDSLEPVLTSREYKYVIDTSPAIFLDFPSGKLCIQDSIIYQGDSFRAIETQIPPGRYKCRVFEIKYPRRYSILYIIMCKTEAQTINHETDIFQFQI